VRLDGLVAASAAPLEARWTIASYTAPVARTAKGLAAALLASGSGMVLGGNGRIALAPCRHQIGVIGVEPRVLAPDLLGHLQDERPRGQARRDPLEAITAACDGDIEPARIGVLALLPLRAHRVVKVAHGPEHGRVLYALARLAAWRKGLWDVARLGEDEAADAGQNAKGPLLVLLREGVSLQRCVECRSTRTWQPKPKSMRTARSTAAPTLRSARSTSVS
jgi:hypothetical protein